MSKPPQIAADPLWFPDAHDANSHTVRLSRVSRKALAEEAFLDDRWDRAGAAQMAHPVSDFASLVAPKRAPRFIWHTAFCGSTLLARCLDKPGSNLSLKEPDVLMSLANMKRTQGPQALQRELGPVLALLARPFVRREQVTIKPSNTVNNLMGDVVALLPDARHLLLYSDLRAFLLSITKKGEPGRAFARQLFTIFAMDGHPIAQTPPRELLKLTDLQIAALVWHMQVASLLAASRNGGAGQIASLDGDRFLHAPEPALNAVDAFLGLGLGADQIRLIVSGPIFGRDSKDPAKAYSAEHRAREAEQTAAAIGPALDATIEWSYGLFPASPRAGGMPHPLLAN
ncbi:hypothetical protein [Maricaulis salignorans]|uniref:Sulfotransferase family protein n=1 Tax=Maricaulis salignorans TaxID=144026 RepID=A0A1G9WGX0_9PROT|nr:hypothetical protein [Maricaulis salignorans]SDM83788.1 hypothetical protein SAMN04488568_1257 [Maricaulis salignorans]